jgi:hypothetical protein
MKMSSRVPQAHVEMLKLSSILSNILSYTRGQFSLENGQNLVHSDNEPDYEWMIEKGNDVVTILRKFL